MLSLVTERHIYYQGVSCPHQYSTSTTAVKHLLNVCSQLDIVQRDWDETWILQRWILKSYFTWVQRNKTSHTVCPEVKEHNTTNGGNQSIGQRQQSVPCPLTRCDGMRACGRQGSILTLYIGNDPRATLTAIQAFLLICQCLQYTTTPLTLGQSGKQLTYFPLLNFYCSSKD